ncbi:MAG TPA: CzcE family metal-binding protein [Burkholderiales bacterium]|nr:CzcE family metal-binding protein [Burkholderiales bacterium]
MKLFVPTLAALTLSAASLSAVALTSTDRFGEPAQPAAADRTIVIGSSTKFVNVKHGEVVKIVAGGKEFAWDFDGLPMAFDLKQIAPEGAIDHSVRVYIATSDQDISIGD